MPALRRGPDRAGPGAEAPKAKPSLGKILLRWGVLLGVLLAAIWSFLWFIVPERQGNPTAQAEARAADLCGKSAPRWSIMHRRKAALIRNILRRLANACDWPRSSLRASTTKSNTRPAPLTPTGPSARFRFRLGPEITVSGISIWMTPESCAPLGKTAPPRPTIRRTDAVKELGDPMRCPGDQSLPQKAKVTAPTKNENKRRDSI